MRTELSGDTLLCHAEVGDGIGLLDRTGVIVHPVPLDALPADVVLVVPASAHLPTVAWGIFDGEQPLMQQYVDAPVFAGDNVNVHIPG